MNIEHKLNIGDGQHITIGDTCIDGSIFVHELIHDYGDGIVNELNHTSPERAYITRIGQYTHDNNTIYLYRVYDTQTEANTYYIVNNVSYADDNGIKPEIIYNRLRHTIHGIFSDVNEEKMAFEKLMKLMK